VSDPLPNAGVHARGAAALSRPPTTALHAAAWSADWGLALAAFLLTLGALPGEPAPRLWWLLLAGVELVALRGLARLAIARSLGQAAWGLQRPAPGNLRAPARLDARARATGIFVTVTAWALAAFLLARALETEPLWLRAREATLQPFMPEQNGDWQIEPFFYALGAWPKLFEGKPVLYSVPYEKGPPSRFPGHLVARWDAPDLRVTFEGPKTPAGPGGTPPARARVRECLLALPSPGCAGVREAVLRRHVEEMRVALPHSPLEWKLGWFLVENAALPPDDQAQGIELSARARDGALERRFILITARGTEQAFILDAPAGSQGEEASTLFERALRSLRVSDELGPGRAWIDRELENLQLDGEGSRSLERLAEAQSLLIAKLSVDPATYDTYFHLGGTAILLARLARREQRPDLSAVARPLVRSAYLFAQDVSANDPRTAQLQAFWLEVQHY
jgi:hypothetical protein